MHNRKKEADEICKYFYVDEFFHPVCNAPKEFRDSCGQFSTEKGIMGAGSDLMTGQAFILYRCDKLKDQCDKMGHLPPEIAFKYRHPLKGNLAAVTVDFTDGTTWVNKKIGRNDPCPCGSGKKFKHCCGKM